MKTRQLTQSLTVSAIGYGAMGLSEFYGDTDDEKSLALLNKLADLPLFWFPRHANPVYYDKCEACFRHLPRKRT